MNMFSWSALAGGLGVGGWGDENIFSPGPQPALGGPAFTTVSKTKKYDRWTMQLPLFVLTFVEFVKNQLTIRHLSANFASLQSL